MKKLGFGLMRMPTLDRTNQADVDIEQVKAMVDRYPRDSFTLATKLHAGFFNSGEEKALCHKAAEVINAQIAVPCTGCSYCTGGCPQHLPIIEKLKAVSAHFDH